jgi:hypothetical protein
MADVVLEDAVGGMPTGPEPEAPAPAPDLSQPLVDPDEPPAGDEPPLPGDEEVEEEGAPLPGGKRTVVNDLVRERERRQMAESNLQSSQELLRQVMSLPGGVELLQSAATGAPPPRKPGEPSEDDRALYKEAQEVAHDLGLYDTEGNPDIRTAARIVLRQRKSTEAALSKALAPLQQTTMSLAAQPVINHVLGVADQFGIDRNLVLQGLNATPPEHLGNPEVQQAVLMMALGTQTMLGTVPPNGNGGAAPRQSVPRGTPMGRALRAPIFTEAPGGRPRSGVVLDDVFRERLKSTGMKDETINASLERFVPGAPNRLE